MSSFTSITRAQVAEKLLAYKDSDMTNPREDDSCIYESQDRKRHCIAGQVLVDLGVPVPTFNDADNFHTGIYSLHDEWLPEHGYVLDSDALSLLAAAQNGADKSGIRWRFVIEELQTGGWL